MFQPLVYWGPATAPAWIDKNVWNWQNMTSKRHDQVASLRLRSVRSSRWQFRSIWRMLFFWLRMAKESTAREIGSLAYVFSTEGIKWNYSKLFEPHTSSISTFCKISPHLIIFPITTGIWPIHTVPSSSLARHRRDASSRDLLPAVARSHSHRSRSCRLPPRQEVGQTTRTVTLV
jgi:hypothetical protein